ncbi:hypothetical protein [Amycolatopsis jiangsuensis]|uniref:Uncharacterized protein n=1 Tax=Amycolatopsis jiangsuensis TaxID=1181879 RepID=A0A840J112_9PSEU|nr:hypothetical protein [Amycolatopsis jiangsuensis]MBB4688676.1 hypothetical protein [Amycolatopsis jiangsuensis]
MADGEVSKDLGRLLRQFGVRAFALAFVAGLTGLSMLALALALAGFALVLAPIRARPVSPADGPAAPGQPES